MGGEAEPGPGKWIAEAGSTIWGEGSFLAKRHKLREWLKTLAFLLVLAFLVYWQVAEPYLMKDDALVPTVEVGERLLIYKLGSKLGMKPVRGEIYLFRLADNDELLRRVVAVEGDLVEIKDCLLYVNGQAENRQYCALPIVGNYGPQLVPAGNVFVLVDNPSAGRDSRDRSVGVLTMDKIQGQAVAVCWPTAAFRLLKR